jgi:purine-binding chemotaxis protein CheW
MSSVLHNIDPLAEGDDRARREFLTFRLGEETYGLDILKVQEIREIDAVTRVPHVARFVRGVINLRGAIVPIVDLGLMFGFPAPITLANASAIVMNVEHRMVGLIVASVSDVIALAEDEITPAPDLGDRAVADFVSAIGTRDDFSILLLDVERVLARIREDTP